MSDWKQNPKPTLPPSLQEIMKGLEGVKEILEGQIESLVKDMDKAQGELAKLQKKSEQVQDLDKEKEKNPSKVLSELEKIQEELG